MFLCERAPGDKVSVVDGSTKLFVQFGPHLETKFAASSVQLDHVSLGLIPSVVAARAAVREGAKSDRVVSDTECLDAEDVDQRVVDPSPDGAVDGCSRVLVFGLVCLVDEGVVDSSRHVDSCA